MIQKAKKSGIEEYLDEIVTNNLDFYVYGSKMYNSDITFTTNEAKIKENATKEYTVIDW